MPQFIRFFLSVLFIFLISHLPAISQEDSGLVFLGGNLAQAKETALEKEKPIYIYICADWAEICGKMPYSTFSDPRVAEKFGAEFVCLNVDIEKSADKDEYIQYGIRNMPTHLFIDANGNMLHRAVGDKSPGEMLQLAETALDPDERFAAMEERYLEGERSVDFLREYLWAAWWAGADYQSAADLLLGMIEEEAYTETENWKLVAHFLDHTSSPVFRYILENREALGNELGHSNIRRKIDKVFTSEIMQKQRLAGGGEWESYIEETFRPFEDIEGIAEIRMATELYLFSRSGMAQEFLSEALVYVEMYGAYHPATFNDIVLFYQQMGEAGQLSGGWENPPDILRLRAEISTLMSGEGEVNELLDASKEYFNQISGQPYQSDMGSIIWVIIQLDDSEETLEMAENGLEKAMEKDPRNYHLHFTTVMLYEQQGKNRKARKYAEKTLEIAETEGLPTEKASQYLEQLGG